jgi:predicted Zn-dependent protease
MILKSINRVHFMSPLALVFFSVSVWAKSDADIGEQMYQKIIADMPIYSEPKMANYVREVGNNLVRICNDPEKKFTFTILDNPNVNAFATPGGYIYINRGLIIFLQSEAQLVAVLAHEIGYVLISCCDVLPTASNKKTSGLNCC